MRRYGGMVLLFFVLLTSTAHATEPTLGAVMLRCGVIRAELEPVQKATAFDTFTFTLLDPNGASVPVDVAPILQPVDLLEGATLTPRTPMVIGKGFFVVLRQDNVIRGITSVNVSSDQIIVDPARRSEFEVTFSCDVNPVTISVVVTRDGKEVKNLAPRIIGELSSARVVTLRAGKQLRHEDTVTVTAETTAGPKVVVEKELDLEAPADIESAIVYVGGKLELAEASKPKVLVDLKYDGSLRPIGKSIRWSHGPTLLVDAATQDSDGEGTAKLGYGLRYLDYFERGRGDDKQFVLTRTDFVPALEADDGLNSRNLIGDLRHQWQFPGTRWNIKPAVGVEGGTNLALKTKLEEFSDYNIIRPTFDFYIARKFEKSGAFKEISFSIDTQSRYLIEEEPDTEPLPRSEQTDDEKAKTEPFSGFKFYGKAALTFGLTETFAIALEYEYGERPPLYGDNNKAGVSIVYSF